MERTLDQVMRDPVWQALYPAIPFVTARFLPPAMNPYAAGGVKIAALTLAIRHMKLVPSRQMLIDDFLAGRYQGVHTLVVPSSGNTADGVIRHARALGIQKVKIVLATDVPASKIAPLRAYGDFVDVMQVSNVAHVAVEEGNKPGHYHLDQYSHPSNPKAHEACTAPAIMNALGRAPAVLAVAMGSGGTAMGIAKFFKEQGHATKVVGVRPKLGEQVPGARDEKRMSAVVTLPWQDHVCSVQEASRKDSFVATRALWYAVEPPPGPTSGLAYMGLMQHLADEHPQDGATVAFLCPDQGAPYADVILAELDPWQGIPPL